MKIIRHFQEAITHVMDKLGKFLNQTPSEEELKKVIKINTAENPLDRELRFPKRSKFKKPKSTFEHKGSSYKGKGKINNDSATFNRARKDIPVGREK